MRRMLLASVVMIMTLVFEMAACSDQSDSENDGGFDAGLLPDKLPFDLKRPAAGTPPGESEVDEFTKKITGFYKQVDYFRWCSWHSHGLAEDYNADMPAYALWWQDTVAVKSGDTVTFEHRGGSDNMMIRTSKVLTNAIAAYLASGDPVIRKLVIDYCHGAVALFQGLEYQGENPPAPYVTARAIFTHNHSYTTEDGRKVAVNYDPVKKEKYDWNAHTVANPDNPYFGSIWVRNMRSKDDVPHIFRTVPLLMRLVQDADDEQVKQAASVALEYFKGFAKDIVDNGYLIRTKEDHRTYVPTEEDNPDSVKDLASFVGFEEAIPNAECDPKLTAALLAYEEPLDNDCGDGISPSYEAIATAGHYFNYAIVRYFHLAAITNALVLGKNQLAEQLLKGLVTRVDTMMSDDDERSAHKEWDADSAVFLVASAASGLPLTAQEARFVQEQYSASVDHFLKFELWDLWSQDVPDGEYNYIPSRDEGDNRSVRITEIVYLFEYCWSPWKNPNGVEFVDCERLLDPSRWGE